MTGIFEAQLTKVQKTQGIKCDITFSGNWSVHITNSNGFGNTFIGYKEDACREALEWLGIDK